MAPDGDDVGAYLGVQGREVIQGVAATFMAPGVGHDLAQDASSLAPAR